MRKLILLLVFYFPLLAFSQNTIGLPDVINYTKQDYAAGLQNWDIKQDQNGIIYFANNEGLLSFDGNSWNLYPLPNKTVVRSVSISQDGKIYVGGQDELGYFSPNNNGVLTYHSLTGSIPSKDKSFGDVWDIASFNSNIFFRCSNKIFKFSNREMVTYYAPSEWTYMELCNNRLLAHDYKAGLLAYENNVWKPLPFTNILPDNDDVTGIIKVNPDTCLITTLKNGLYYLAKNGLSRLISGNNALFQQERIYAATIVNEDQIALGTNNGGVFIIDKKGEIIQRFSRSDGLQNNNVLSIFPDNQHNLWVGMDNGIDLVTYNSSIKQIIPSTLEGSGYTSIIFQNHLFIGTTNGLYNVALQPVKDLSFSKGNFTQVNNTKGQVWNLAAINNTLLMGHHEGAFEIKNNTAISISKQPGFWNFIPHSNTFPISQVVAGYYKGLQFFNYTNGNFIPSFNITGFVESSRFVAIDNDDNIWVSHPYHGIYRITKNISYYSTQLFTNKNGLPSVLNNYIYKIKNEIVAATEKGIYTYEKNKDSFIPSPYYQKLLGNQSIRYIKDDPAGNIWFIHEKTLGVIDFSSKQPSIIYFPELNNKMLSGFEFINPVDENNIFVGGEKGFFHINYEKYKKNVPVLSVQIRSVKISDKSDSILFGGYPGAINEKQAQDKNKIPEIANKWKAINFEYASPIFGYQSNLEYSYRLKGYDDNWSDWKKRSEKEYTNLPAGTYNFEVKVRNNLGNESPVSAYSFTILPPWYRTWLANILYLALFIAALYIFYRVQQKKFILQQEKYEKEQKRLSYIHELELNKSENELIALRNEKLEAEINYKNSELASTAMHLLKKGELFSKIKNDLNQVIKGLEKSTTSSELKKMIKKLNEEENMDKEWENFAKHFDKVHSDFVIELKENHPTLTPNEVKLCAYLRMNLSTKEIAQLLNISVRGVEISRYRLRKKLAISTETNLFDYLINIKTKN